MRKAFINTLLDLAIKNNKIFLLTGDLGFSVLEEFQERFPDRFFNIGVGECNMASIASGLALTGKIIYIYSIVPFVTMRCFERVRNDICMQNLNVKIIGIGGGLDYGSEGPTHHSIIDIAIMRAIPNMTVVCPGDSVEAAFSIKESVKYKRPMYIRLAKGHVPQVFDKDVYFKIGEGITIKEGSDITIIATGNMLYSAKKVTDKLVEKGISVHLISMHTVKPIDRGLILKSIIGKKAVFTIEEHSIIGGLGSSVAEVLSESSNNALFRRIGLQDAFVKDIGDREYLLEKNSLSVNNILNNILKVYKTIE